METEAMANILRAVTVVGAFYLGYRWKKKD